jgi:hypothetical protein
MWDSATPKRSRTPLFRIFRSLGGVDEVDDFLPPVNCFLEEFTDAQLAFGSLVVLGLHEAMMQARRAHICRSGHSPCADRAAKGRACPQSTNCGR